MKKVLVPCDFSDAAVQAFKFAAEITRKSKGEIILLHVIEVPVLESSVGHGFEKSYLEERKASAERNVARMREKWAKHDQKIETVVEFGAAVPSIKKFLEKKKVDLVIMGTHGAKGLREFVVGSNTEKIVRNSPVPVLAVKKAPGEIKEIVFPTVPEAEIEDLMMKLKDLQDFFGARLRVVFINTPGHFRRDLEMKKLLAAMAKRFMLKNYTVEIYNDLSEQEGIANYANEVKADIIAIRTHGRGGIAHLASGSIAEDVVNNIDCSIWTYKVK